MRYLKCVLSCFFLAMILVGCQQPNVKNELVTVNSDTVDIFIGVDYLESYTTLRNVVQHECLYGYNNKEHTIDLFDLKERKPIKQISLEKEGANGIVYPHALTIHQDTVWIQTATHFFATDLDGKIIWRLDKKELDKQIDHSVYSFSSTGVTVCNFEDLVYDSNRQELVVPIYLLDPFSLEKKQAVATIQVKEKKVTLLPIPFPETIIHDYYGKLSTPQLLVKGDSLVYNFPNSAAIHIFNRKNGEITTHHIESEYTANLSETIRENANATKILDHYLHALFFHKVQYDEKRGLYYRLHTDHSTDRAAFSNKETYLTIISSDFKKLKEVKLPANCYPFYVITDDGLLFQFMEGLKEDMFSYQIVTTDEIQKIKGVEKNEVSIHVKSETQQSKQDSSKVMPKKRVQPTVKKMNVQELAEFFKQKMVYPEQELKEKVEGIVMLSLTCDKEGKVIGCKIIEQATTTENENLREEALRLANLAKWVEPGVMYMVHISFDIEDYLKRNMH